MKIVKFELHKIWNKKYIILIVTVFLMLNMLSMWYLQNARELPSHTFYKEIEETLSGMEEDEKGEYLRNKAQIAFHSTQNPEDTEGIFFQELYQDWKEAFEYDIHLKQIEADAKLLTSISIFQPKDNLSFSFRNIQKTAKDYSVLQGNIIPYVLSEGVSASINAPLTDALLVCLSFIFALILIFQEKKKGLISVLRATPKGRKELVIGKLGALGIVLFLMVTLLYAGNFIYGVLRYGWTDINMPIQALRGFKNCPLSINIQQFLILFIVMKWLAVYAFSCIIVLVTIHARNAATGFFVCAFLYGVSYAMMRYIPFISPLGLLRYMNPVGIMDTTGIWSEYYNLNVAGFPMGMQSFVVLFTLMIAVVFIFFSILSFHRKRNWETNEFFLTGKMKKGFIGRNVHSQLMFELYKLLIVNKGLWILLLYGACAVALFPSFVPELSLEQKQLKSYMTTLHGELNDEKLEFIKQEEELIEEAHVKIDWIMKQVEDEKITKQGAQDWSSKYTAILLREPIFLVVKERVDYVHQHSDTQLLFEDGFVQLISKSGNPIILLITLTTFILLFGEYFSMEYQSGMIPILWAAPNGRRKTVTIKIKCTILVISVITMISLLSVLLPIMDTYGLTGIMYSIRSISSFRELPWNLPIIVILLLHYISQVLANLIGTIIILAMSNRLRRSVGAISASVVILILPIALSLMKIPLVSYLSLHPIYNFASYIILPNNRFIVFLFLGIWFAVGGMLLYLIFAGFGSWDRHKFSLFNKGKSC